MNAAHEMRTVAAEAGANIPVDTENRLALNREVLRHRRARAQSNRRSGMSGALDELARMSLPVARQAVRQHPYANLAGAALAGVLLVERKPCRRLGGSVLIGWLARRALDGLMAAARTNRTSDPPL